MPPGRTSRQYLKFNGDPADGKLHKAVTRRSACSGNTAGERASRTMARRFSPRCIQMAMPVRQAAPPVINGLSRKPGSAFVGGLGGLEVRGDKNVTKPIDAHPVKVILGKIKAGLVDAQQCGLAACMVEVVDVLNMALKLWVGRHRLMFPVGLGGDVDDSFAFIGRRLRNALLIKRNDSHNGVIGLNRWLGKRRGRRHIPWPPLRPFVHQQVLRMTRLASRVPEAAGPVGQRG